MCINHCCFFMVVQTPPESPKRAIVKVGCTLSPAAARWKLTSRMDASWNMESTTATCTESRLTPYMRWWRLDASAYWTPTLRYACIPLSTHRLRKLSPEEGSLTFSSVSVSTLLCSLVSHFWLFLSAACRWAGSVHRHRRLLLVKTVKAHCMGVNWWSFLF